MIVAIFASWSLTADSARVQQCMRFALTRLESKLAIQHGTSHPWPEQAFIYAPRHVEKELAVWLVEHGVPEKRLREIDPPTDDGLPAKRDRILSKNAGAVVAIWDGFDKRIPTAVNRAAKRGLPIVVEVVT